MNKRRHKEEIQVSNNNEKNEMNVISRNNIKLSVMTFISFTSHIDRCKMHVL